MSKYTQKALEDLAQSEFIFHDNHTLEVINAVIIWKNFKGEANKFGNTTRNFDLVINEEVFDGMKEAGWNVKTYETEDGILYFVNVKVNMSSAFPPTITVFTDYRGRKSRVIMNENTVGELDRMRIQSADLIVNAYRSKQNPDKITGYLKKLNVIQDPIIEFGGKYDDWDDAENQKPEPIDDDDDGMPF